MRELQIEHTGVISKNHSFGEWLRFYTSEQIMESPPRFTKALFYQFANIAPKHFSFQTVLPNVRLVVLKRLNLLDHTSSLYLAKKLKKWHLRNEEDLRIYVQQKVEIDELELIKTYEEAISDFNVWDCHIRNVPYLEVYYEDLLSDPLCFMLKILRFLEVDVSTHLAKNSITNTNLELLPTNHPAKCEIVSFLKSSGVAEAV
jgi:LPS sulfotransferase NodH